MLTITVQSIRHIFPLAFQCETDIHWYNVNLAVMLCRRDHLQNVYYPKDTLKIVLENVVSSKRYLDQEEKEHQWLVSNRTVLTS